MSKLKIFVSYKYKKPILSNEFIVPIQTGRAISKQIFDGMIGDDTGDNISKENARYNELTAQYWVWKNYQEIGNPEYVGFMHYRRQFIFDENLKHLPYIWLPGSKFYFVKNIYDNYISHFTPNIVFPHLDSKPDSIVFNSIDVKVALKVNNMKKHFYKGLRDQKKEVFEIFEEVIKNNFSEYEEAFEEFKNGTEVFICNSFIMPKELFFEYSEFLFGVLGKVDAKVDYSRYNTSELRFIGYLGEYLLTIFLFKKRKNPDFKIKELAGTFVSTKYRNIRIAIIKSKILLNFTRGKTYIHYAKRLIRCRKRIVN